MTKADFAALPLALKCVAGLFSVYGLWAAYDMAAGFAVGRMQPNFGIFCLLVGPGLLTRHEIARMCALAITVVLLFFTLDTFARFVVDRPPGVGVPVLSRLFGLLHGAGRTWYVVMSAMGFFALNLWQVWVLMRPDVRRQFGHNA